MLTSHNSFDNMNLKAELLRGIYAFGQVKLCYTAPNRATHIVISDIRFERPSALQQRAIVPMVKGHDMIVQGELDTVNITTLSISILQKIDTNLKVPQALILAPSREVSLKIRQLVITLGNYMNIECHACVGGTNIEHNMAKLREGVHVVVGAPGRVLDMINRMALKPNHIKILWVPEVDEIMSRGLMDQIYEIFQLLPQDKQVVLMSPTMSMEALEVTKKLMRDPIRFLAPRDELTLEGTKHFYVAVEKEEWKFESLCDLYETVTITQAVIFCNTQRQVDWLTEQMTAREFTVLAMVRRAMAHAILKSIVHSLNRTLFHHSTMTWPQIGVRSW
jgi:translation initiation factor 4A